MSAILWRHRAEYAVVVSVRALVGVLPAFAGGWIGAAVGLLFYAVDGSHRRLTIDQLHVAFPTRSVNECRVIARRTFMHFGRLLVAALRASTQTPAAFLDSVDVEGEEQVRAALAAGHGAIIFSGHYGYWELHGLAHALVLSPMSVLARPLDNPYLHTLLEQMRRATGNNVIYRQGALRKVLRALKHNECVAMLIDQHIQGADAVNVEFFGRPAATTTALASLALRTGARLVPAFAIPLPNGRCRLVYEPAVDLPRPGAADPVRELTQRCTDVLEMYVRRDPHLWLWMHRRWRERPETGPHAAGMFPVAADESESTER
ncbi:MAG: lysophospholipid acyltransferase family protein [Vicinamibacterales bacterium]